MAKSELVAAKGWVRVTVSLAIQRGVAHTVAVEPSLVAVESSSLVLVAPAQSSKNSVTGSIATSLLSGPSPSPPIPTNEVACVSSSVEGALFCDINQTRPAATTPPPINSVLSTMFVYGWAYYLKSPLNDC